MLGQLPWAQPGRRARALHRISPEHVEALLAAGEWGDALGAWPGDLETELDRA